MRIVWPIVLGLVAIRAWKAVRRRLGAWAVASNRVGVLRQLLRIGLPLDATMPQGQDLLGYAICHGHGGVAQLLLERGAGPDRSGSDRTRVSHPLVLAAMSSGSEMVDVLLRYDPSLARDHQLLGVAAWALAVFRRGAVQEGDQERAAQLLAGARTLLRGAITRERRDKLLGFVVGNGDTELAEVLRCAPVVECQETWPEISEWLPWQPGMGRAPAGTGATTQE